MAQAPEGQRSPDDGGGAGGVEPAVEEQVTLSDPPSSQSSLSEAASKKSVIKDQQPAIGTPDAQPTSSKLPDTSPVTRESLNPTLEPPSLAHRTSITFSSQMDRRRPRRGAADDDGSADETVPIIGREQGGHSRDYQSISPQITAKRGQEGSPAAGNGIQRREAEEAAVAAEAKEGKWWKKVVEKYGSVELENKGSVARDHLALERTFLAWLRTSLSFASIGIAITQLFRLNTAIAAGGNSNQSTESPQAKLRHVGKPLGATFIAISILILFIGFHRYFESQHYVIRGKFPASRGSILMVSVVAGALIVASLVVVLAIAPSAFEK